MRVLAGLSLLGVALAGCTMPQVVGRYASATCRDDTGAIPAANACGQLIDADVSVVLAPPPAASNRTGLSLPDGPLAEYIKAMAQPQMSGTPAALRQNIAGVIRAAPAASPFRDASVTPGLLTVTIANGRVFSPADRIEQASVTIRLDGAEFIAWTAAKTAYSEVRPGTITGSREINFSAGLEAKPPTPIALGLTANASATARQEEVFAPVLLVEDITVRIERNHASLPRPDRPDTLVVERSGGLGKDLRGNAQVEVSLRPTVRAVTLEVFNFTPGEAGARGLRTRPSMQSEMRRLLADPIRASVTMDYVVRHIISGANTAQDADDQVEFVSRRVVRDVILADQSELYSVQPRVGRHQNDSLRIQRFAGDQDGADLCFDNEGDARALSAHLQQYAVSEIGGRTMGFFQQGRLVALRPGEIREWGPVKGCGILQEGARVATPSPLVMKPGPT